MAQSIGAIAAEGLLLGVITTAIVVRSRSFDVPVVWPLVSFSSALLAVIVDLAFGLLPVFPDAFLYDQMAWDTLQAWQQGQPLPSSFPNVRTQAYASLVAVVYAVSGRVPFVAITLNAGIWALCICYWLRLNREAFTGQSVVLGVLLSVYPAGVIYASNLLRESLTILFLAITILHLFRWFQNKDLNNAIVGGVGFALVSVLRPELSPVILSSVSITTIISIIENKKIMKRYALTTAAAGLATLALSYSNVSSYYLPLSLEYIETKRKNLAEYPFSYLENLSYDSWIDLVTYLPIRLFHFLFQPFPWVPSNYHLTFATIDAAFVLVVVPLAVLGVVRHRSQLSLEHTFLLIFATTAIVGYALVVSTKGATTRRRLITVPVLLLFANLVLPQIQVVYRS